MADRGDEAIVLDDAMPFAAADRRTVLLALLGIVVPVACGIIAAKFAVIFTDLVIRVPPTTAWFLHPRAHALAAIVLAGLSPSSRRPVGVAVYAVVATTYVVTFVLAMFSPLMVTIEQVGSA